MENIRLSKSAHIGRVTALTTAFFAIVLILAWLTKAISGSLKLVVLGGIIALAMFYVSLIIRLSFQHWQRRDEAQQTASTWAWMWGGRAGLIAMVPIITGFEIWVVTDHGAGLGHLIQLFHLPTSLSIAYVLGMVTGMVAVLLPMAIGQQVARGLWWSKRR